MTTTLLTMQVGSRLHGIHTEASDYDYMSIVAAPLTTTLGIGPEVRTRTERSAPKGVRASAGDVEHVTYELRHWMRLAVAGNPNMLLPFYAPDSAFTFCSAQGQSLRELAPHVVSQTALYKHYGYLRSQFERMKGNGPHQSRKPNRPELTEAHGYDTKYAAHALRLGWQGCDLAALGIIQLPMCHSDRKYLRSVRAGEVSEAEVTEKIKGVLENLAHWCDVGSPALPEHPDLDYINDWLIKVQSA